MAEEFWHKAQEAEVKFWGQGLKTYGEETKQVEIYAPRMRLTPKYGNYIFDLEGRSIIDIGCGPTSLLLKCINFSKAYAIDPMPMPDWVKARYEAGNITFLQGMGEDAAARIGTADPGVLPFDEVWIYNVLQHTEDPKKVLDSAKQLGKLIRIFEWVDVPTDQAHPHVLKKEELDSWLGKPGLTEQINEGDNFTNAYYNVIKL